MTQQQRFPWFRIGAESVSIVASILLAFAINAWWAAHQDRAEEKRLLGNLRSELQENLRHVEREINYRNAVISSIFKIFEASSGHIALAPNELDHLIGDITWWAEARYSRGVLDELLEGARLSVISDNALRELLAGLPYKYQLTEQAELQDMEFAKTVIIPYLRVNASLSQIANTMSAGRPGTGESPTKPVYPVVESVDHTWLIHEPEFQGILVQEHWNHLDALAYLGRLQVELERGVKLIGQSLGSE